MAQPTQFESQRASTPVISSGPITSYSSSDGGADVGFLFLLFGVFWHVIEGFQGKAIFSLFTFPQIPFVVHFAIGAAFWLGASMLIFEKKGWIFSLLLLMGYLIASQMKNTFALIISIVLFITVGLIWHKENFRTWAADEFKIGLLLFVIFAFDIGLIYFIGAAPEYLLSWFPWSYELPLTELATTLVNTIPWWGALGALTANPRTENGGFLGAAAKVTIIMAMILYLIGTIMVVATPQIGHSADIPTPSEIEELLKEQTEGKPQSKGNRLGHQIKCLLDGKGGDLDACIEDLEVAEACGEFEDKEIKNEENEDYQSCLNKVKGIKPKEQVTGGIDPTIKEFTKVEIKPSSISSGQKFSGELITSTSPVPLEITIETPRLDLKVLTSCTYKVDDEIIPGRSSRPEIIAKKGSIRNSFSCSPELNLPKEKQIKMKVTARIENMQTESRLARVFISPTASEATKKLIQDERFSRGETKSVAPPEFVKINFGFGDTPDNPLIEGDQLQLLVGLEKVKNGKIVTIKEIRIRLPEGLAPIPEQCDFQTNADGTLTQTTLTTEKANTKTNVNLGLCSIEVTSKIKEKIPENYFIFDDSSTAVIVYDYQIEEELALKVTG
jgi:hypothetical protein